MGGSCSTNREKRSACSVFLMGHSEGSIPVEITGVYGMVILRWMLKTHDGRAYRLELVSQDKKNVCLL